MGFRNDAYATVWDSKEGKGNYNDIQLSISKKNKQTGKYETEFSGWVRFVGDAKELGLLPKMTRIQIKSCDLTNFYSKEKDAVYWNPVVFQADIVESNGTVSAPKASDMDFMQIDESELDEVPFN